jgi:hypothetical protein
LHKALTTLITQTLPSLFPEALPPTFAPHITLSADTVSAALANPQEWLNQLQLSDVSGLQVTIGELEVGSIFFQKLIQLCEKTEHMCELAATCRRAGMGEGESEGREWAEGSWRPHCSLV